MFVKSSRGRRRERFVKIVRLGSRPPDVNSSFKDQEIQKPEEEKEAEEEEKAEEEEAEEEEEEEERRERRGREG
ncbi:unnamed protein product [Spirodela intermedia]|uniref:Uncharacterized protein n=1 Tax=Spirodela intermedia TaxID=51605 RepID=A0ABN7EAF9_SPIIN|nr:unnamed protein product [Spirodela intermedia]